MINLESVMDYYFTAVLVIMLILLALFGGPNYG